MTIKNNSGFTVTELLIVIAIVAVGLSIVLLAYNGITRRAYTVSVENDVRAMDVAQKYYMAATNNDPLEYSTSETPQDTLVFRESGGNVIVVKVLPNKNYCVYGYHTRSEYQSATDPFIRATIPSANCPAIAASAGDPNATRQTVAIIGGRIAEFWFANGQYPAVNELDQIGLVITKSSENATQQQLYCKDTTKAIYVQIDSPTNKVFVYDTLTGAVTEDTSATKLSLKNTCPRYNIHPTDPGYESTGVKDPDL